MIQALSSLGLGDGGSSPAWVQKAVLGQIAVMVFMPLLISLFIPAQVQPSVYQDEMDQIMDSYNKMTGRNAASEEIWALTGIYTQYGYDQYGERSLNYGTTDDGWIYGSRIAAYSPTQYYAEYEEKEGETGKYVPDPKTPDEGGFSYIVTRDDERGFYYYTWAGRDLQIDYKNTDYDPEANPQGGTFDSDHPQLYTRVHMDVHKKSTVFITSGSKETMADGTFYYDFNGYRYSFSPFEDYNYDQKTGIKAKNSSCSLIWYQYTSDSGIQGQLVVSGTDSGIQYVTGASIVKAFDQATSTAKFTFRFAGVDVYMYVQLDPYALYSTGLTPEDCYNEGYFSVMITTPKYVTSGNQGGSTISFDINKIWDTMVGLFTFNPELYGLQDGSIAGMTASIVFIMPLYAALLAMGTICWPILIGLALVQAICTLGSLWPF